MKPILLTSEGVCRIATWLNGNTIEVAALALFPFIIVRRETTWDSPLYNHEHIHFRQQLELLVVFWYLLYAFDYVVNRLQGYGHADAYFRIRLEQEAYENQGHPFYLVDRKRFSWWRYKLLDS